MGKPPTLPLATYEILETLDLEAERDFYDFCVSEQEIGELREATREGLIHAVAVNENGNRIGTLFYAIGRNNTFIVLGISAKSEEPFGVFRRMTWLRDLVKDLGCTRVVAETRRSGVFRALLELGFKPFSVEMSFEL